MSRGLGDVYKRQLRALLPALMLHPERKEGRVNINYRFPSVYIESNLVTVRHTSVFSHKFAVIEWIITIDAIAQHFL